MYSYKYPHPAVTADSIVFARDSQDLKVLLIQRKREPYQGSWAFPGGFMNIDESAEDAARRELQEETGLKADVMAQVGAWTAVDRDPRERVITIAYYTLLPHPAAVTASDDANQAQWFSLSALPPLAFDHADILHRAITLLHQQHGV